MRITHSFLSPLIITTVLHFAGSLPAQERPRFEGFRGTQRETVDADEPPPPLSDREFQRAERAWKQAADKVEQQSSRLAQLSFEAYRRGLMPLPDHLAHLKLAASSERLLIPFDDNGGRFSRGNVERLQRVVKTLERVNLAGAWRSEILLARALLAEAKSLAATAEGRDQLAEAEYTSALDLAQQHLVQHRRDSVVGFRQGGATRFENGDIVNDARFGGWEFFIYAPEAYTELPPGEFLQDAVSLLRSWRPQFPNEPGSKEAYIAQYQLGRYQLRQSLAGESEEYAALYQDADEAARQLFALQVEYHQTGTALLFDIALAWELRDELAEVLVEHGLPVPSETEEGLQSDMETLKRMAESVMDRRGRIQADLMNVDLLVARGQARGTLAALQNSGRPDYVP